MNTKLKVLVLVKDKKDRKTLQEQKEYNNLSSDGYELVF